MKIAVANCLQMNNLFYLYVKVISVLWLYYLLSSCLVGVCMRVL